MIVISNTTPLNYLILTESVHVLPAIFGRVYAPSLVIKELSHPRSPEAVRAWASSPPEWLIVQDPTHIDASLKLGAGETAAISLALELKANRILIDERKGYKAAQKRGLNTSSTLGILEEASYRGLIDFEKTIERLGKETTFYVSEVVLDAFKRRAREQKLAQEQEHEAKAKQPKRRKKTRDRDEPETRR
jgi:predicted nucleic acid-binding protein